MDVEEAVRSSLSLSRKEGQCDPGHVRHFMKYLRVVWAILVEIVTHPFEDGYLMFDKDGRLKERL